MSSSNRQRTDRVQIGQHRLDLITAISEKDVEGVKHLAKNEALMNTVNDDGWTALHCAVSIGICTEICAILINAGVDVNAKTNRGTTVLHWAASYGNAKLCEILIEARANVHERTDYGMTAVDYAKMWGRGEIVQMLNNSMNQECMKKFSVSLIIEGNKDNLNV